MKKNTWISKFKAIETKYNGYHFRSRLEARYAVFFDTLGIPYYYEHEGYSLEGLSYLPDFYLPQQDCFIEIKGQDPTEEEFFKARLLAVYTGKPTHIFAGNIELPGDDNDEGNCFVYSYGPPTLQKFLESEELGGPSTQNVNVAPEIIGVEQRSFIDLNITIDLEDDGNFLVSIPGQAWDLKETDRYVAISQERNNFLLMLQQTVNGREDEFRRAHRPEKGWRYDFMYGYEESYGKWYECSACGDLVVGPVNYISHACSKELLQSDSPHILTAYETARSARF